MNLGNWLKGIPKMAADNSPHILTAIGVTGTITTAIFAGTASFKAAEVLAEAAIDEVDDFYPVTLTEYFRHTWKLYIPAAVSAGSTVACILLANRIGTRRAAAMAMAYALQDQTFTDYRRRVIEQIGKNKEEEVRGESAKAAMNRTDRANDLFLVGDGKVLCFEHFTGRYFESDMETLRRAQNDINSEIIRNMYASLGDFYDLVGLDPTEISEELGWTIDNQLDIQFAAILTKTGQPCISITYRALPIRSYHKFS